MSFINGIVNLFRFDKTNWRAVALCLVAATVFWFFNALNKDHTATISFPIDFKYNEASFIPVQDLPHNVLINITGNGWDLLRRSVGFKVTPLLISIDRPSEIKKIPPGSILALATAQFDQLKINHVASDTLQVLIDKRKVKKYKLYVLADQIRFEKNFDRCSQISIEPDSVELTGPISVLNQLTDSIQLQLPDRTIDENVNTDGEIVLSLIDGVTKSFEKAKVKFEVSRMIDLRKKIKIVVFPAPPFRYQLSIDSVQVQYRVPEKLKDSLTQADLFAVVDLREYDAGTVKTVPKVKGSIPFARLISTDSITLRKY